MQKNILKFTEAGDITLEGFDLIRNNRRITIKIFGYRKVVITPNTPDKIMECHNIIKLTDHQCFEPGLVAKLVAAGIETNTYFFFATDAYYIGL